MIARRLTPAEQAALQPGDKVLWLKNGGTNYKEAVFMRLADNRQGWCWIAEGAWEGKPDEQAKTPVRLDNLGTDKPRWEGNHD